MGAKSCAVFPSLRNKPNRPCLRAQPWVLRDCDADAREAKTAATARATLKPQDQSCSLSRCLCCCVDFPSEERGFRYAPCLNAFRWYIAGIPLRPLFQRLPVVHSWDYATPPVSTPSGGTELGFRYVPCFNAFRWYIAGITLRPLFQRLPVVQSWDSATPPVSTPSGGT